MVDFQSRDTRRGVDDDEDDDAAADSEAAADNEPEPTEAVTEEPNGTATTDEPNGTATDDAGDETTDAEVAADQTGYAVVTVSANPEETRIAAGRSIVDAVEGAGDAVTWQDGIRNEYDAVQGALSPLVDREDVEVVLTVGGTGVAPGDVTVEAVTPLLDKDLSGFGELLRSRFAEEIGSAAMGVRVTAGVIEGTPVFCLPADAGAVELAMTEFVLPEAPGLAEMARGE